MLGRRQMVAIVFGCCDLCRVMHVCMSTDVRTTLEEFNRDNGGTGTQQVRAFSVTGNFFLVQLGTFG